MARAASLYELVADAACDDAIALLAPGRAPLSYAALRHQVDHIGSALAALGVMSQHRVAVALRNGPEFATAVLGVAAHATCAPLDLRMRERELADTLTRMRVGHIIVAADNADEVHNAAAIGGVTCIDARWSESMPAGCFTMGAPVTREAAPAGPENVALLLQTSGTTAAAKRVLLTHAQLCRSAASIAASLRLQSQDRCLNLGQLFSTHGLVTALFASLHAGASVVCTPGLIDRSFLRWLAEFHPTWYTAVPTVHRAVLDEIEQEGGVVPTSLRLVRSTSAPLPATLAARLEAAFGVPVVDAYGMTEATGQITSNALPPLPRVAGSVGLSTGTEVAILGEDGRRLPARAAGDVAIRGDNVITRYEATDEVNARAFKDGWLLTGDIGSLDENGYLRLLGRSKDVINRGGYKVMPLEVESVLREHESVADCAVFAVPHPSLGEDVVAAVVLARPAESAHIEAWMSERVYAVKMPSRIVIVDSLPLGATGKLLRARLAESLAPRLTATLEAPRSDVEAQVVGMCAELLRTSIGVHDNFFLMGGDSLLGTQLLARVRQRFGVELTLATLFAHATPACLAEAIATTMATTDRAPGRFAG